MMGWEKQQGGEEAGEVKKNGIAYVKVMTDEQLETLRKQISVYATICEQLVEMHKNLTSHPDLPAGLRLYCDPMMTSSGHKITARQRWTPTPVQLQMLERIFDQGNGTPTKQKIKDITADLSHHGQITETNVYNWFQNRRARSKRKHHDSADDTKPLDSSAAPLNNFPQLPFYDNPGPDHLSGKMEVAADTYGIYDHDHLQDYTLS